MGARFPWSRDRISTMGHAMMGHAISLFRSVLAGCGVRCEMEVDAEKGERLGGAKRLKHLYAASASNELAFRSISVRSPALWYCPAIFVSASTMLTVKRPVCSAIASACFPWSWG